MWLPRVTYRQLVRQLVERSKRIRELEQALELERHENRLAERHWANALLRAKQAYPLAGNPVPVAGPPKDPELVPAFDPGEREALIATARDMGIENPEQEADRILREERGQPW